ncbi:BACON domain-containing protein, partial [Parapedobacter sp. SGR-10]|uniref:BACON domain-containing protein n=1 Tax=Parapedobacter sp. SGR-10 TaxID=2710879 RepID=UPI0013D49B70
MLGKSIKNFVNSGIFLGFMVLLASCKKNTTEEFSPRVGVDVDVIEFPYAGSEQEFTVRANGPWSVSLSDESWLSLSLTEGTLTDGSPEKVRIQATRNSGSSREATVTIAIEGQSDIEISVIQEDGFVLLGDAGIEGILKADQAMDETNLISIPYTRGTVDEKIVVSVAVSGEGAAGITPIEDMELTIGSEQGKLSIPLTGIPSNEGAVEFAISISNGYTYSLSAQIVAKDALPVGEIYYDEKFDKMVWGGDYVNRQAGIMGGFKLGEGGYVIDEDIPVTTVDYLTPGSYSFIASGGMAVTYRILRGILTQEGARGLGGGQILERPGYLQVGDGVKSDGLITRQIWTIPSGQTRKVRVSVDLAIWEGSSKIIRVSRNAGAGQLSVSELEVENHSEWRTYEFFITGASNLTRIRFATDTEKGPDNLYGRFFIRNILVQEV